MEQGRLCIVPQGVGHATQPHARLADCMSAGQQHSTPAWLCASRRSAWQRCPCIPHPPTHPPPGIEGELEGPKIKQLERLLRRVLDLPGRPAIVLMQVPSHGQAPKPQNPNPKP